MTCAWCGKKGRAMCPECAYLKRRIERGRYWMTDNPISEARR